MSILIDAKTPVIVQGFTGEKASFHAREMIAYGTHLAGGPGISRREVRRPRASLSKDRMCLTGGRRSTS